MVAVCDLADNPALGRRQNVQAGSIVIYRGGREVARNEGETRAAFNTEMSLLGLSMPGA